MRYINEKGSRFYCCLFYCLLKAISYSNFVISYSLTTLSITISSIRSERITKVDEK